MKFSWLSEEHLLCKSPQGGGREPGAMRASVFITSRKCIGYRADVQKSTSFGVRENELEFWFLHLFIVLVKVGPRAHFLVL